MTNQKTSDIIKSSKEREVTNMRRVNYRVRKADGTEFHTTSYREATMAVTASKKLTSPRLMREQRNRKSGPGLVLERFRRF